MHRSVSILALIGVAGACVTTHPDPPSRSVALLSEAPAPEGRKCRLQPLPEQPLSVDLLVDSAALAAAILPLHRAAGEGYLIFSMQVDRNGWNSRRAVIEHDLSATLADSVQSLLFTNLRHTEPGEPWGVRLRVDIKDPIRFRLGQQELCEARLRTHSDLVRSANMFDVRSSEMGPMAGHTTVWLAIDIEPSGTISDVRIQRTPQTIRNTAPLLNFGHSLSFDAASLDGIPVASTAIVPVRLR
ncbi:hypothetical protein BH23GEM6_BH23GEM6_03090 [soil metagenome]